MSLFLLRRPVATALGLGFASAITTQTLYKRSLLCEAPRRGPFGAYERDAKVPVTRGGRLNSAAFRQISSGSVLGLLSGVAVSTFSRTLAFLFGLVVFGAQYLQSNGINVIPTERLQRYVKGIDLRSLMEDNVAFKLSFGATFTLAAFAGL